MNFSSTVANKALGFGICDLSIFFGDQVNIAILWPIYIFRKNKTLPTKKLVTVG